MEFLPSYIPIMFFLLVEAWIASDWHIVPACSSDVDDNDKEAEEILDVLNNEDKDDNDDNRKISMIFPLVSCCSCVNIPSSS